MSDAVIKVDKLSKRYRIGSLRDSRDALRHRLEEWVRSPWRRLKSWRAEHGPATREFWALRDVSFDIKQGEVVGFIGRNGAGKSTLLKILSRITEPTAGRVWMRGRVASLLEVGTGFHQELTGRENIFLNGAILGMTRGEIKQKFDEIVAFSEVEAFLDTPVKRYSSGMYVRLAFAIAAHLEPEILIVDEVLAVGDSQFQKKCLGKMGEVARGGRTVLFVSHNLNAVTSLCSKAVVLKQGRLVFAGAVGDALAFYGASTQVAGCVDFTEYKKNSLLRTLEIHQNGRPTEGVLEPLGDVAFNFSLVLPGKLNQPRLSAAFSNSKGERVFAVGSWLGPRELPPLIGNQTVQICFTMPSVIPGRYTLDISFHDNEAGINEEYYSAGGVEVAETNYLQMMEPAVAELGQLYVRSTVTVLANEKPVLV
jgi:lipopolysaccharide transport system ATP-binding protein